MKDNNAEERCNHASGGLHCTGIEKSVLLLRSSLVNLTMRALADLYRKVVFPEPMLALNLEAITLWQMLNMEISNITATVLQ